MPNRFEQSAPPSIDRLYRSLPVGPFGVPPMIKPARTWTPVRKPKVEAGHHRLFGFISLLRRLTERVGIPIALSRRARPIGSAECCP